MPGRTVPTVTEPEDPAVGPGADRPSSTRSRRPVAATTLGDLLHRRAAEHPAREAIVFPAERASYGELADRAHALGRGLLALGVAPGDRVGILLPASVDLVALLVAVTDVGAIAVPINARFKAVELSGIVAHSGMRVLVTAPPQPGEPDFLDLLAETFPHLAGSGPGELVLPEAPELRHVVHLGGPGGAGIVAGAEFDALAAGTDPAAVERAAQGVRVRDTALLVYTSGTTASPKGAMLSHEAVTRLADGIARERMPLSGADRVWTAIPLFHGGGITFALSCLTAGATFVHPRFFDPSTTLDLLVRERVTVALAAFETIWMPVLNRPDFAEHDLSRIRVVMAVGVPERLRTMAARLPHAVHVSCVAMTESSAFLTLNRLDDPPAARAETGGHPMPGMQCRVVDPESGADLPPGTPGELLFRGPNAFDGYFRDPELTAQVFDEHGWFHSGDVVVADEDGRLTFLSRLKDMLKVGGENVSAAEVEGHLLGHPAVGIVAVVAAPDARYVEVPAAFVQLAPGQEATEQELVDFCVGRIASYRVPRYIRFVTEWPMSGTKIRKVELRRRIAAELDDAGVTEAPRVDGRHG
ncbi:AMP-binding protein [Pseudonocardia parietis]|uniref:Fatty-acyl-CoA synthase n=1 Tax=Pseudonocardia parietis TaxID=570936 RepID=A0ABS4VV55_9PSEU|nr:AMP-binding protein [Pseudonocardia parietis]MBP2367791.1 fatty-acyl-CoA synthase [Pseudonocardia parietis]